MKKVIQFTKIRYIMFVISLLLIAGGITGTILNGGFNLGIDFQAGLNQRIQIAPVAMSLNYSGNESGTFDVSHGVVSLSFGQGDSMKEYEFSFESYSTMKAMASAISDVDGISVEIDAPELTSTSQLIGLSYPVEFTGTPVNVNFVDSGSAPVVIEDIRNIISEVGNPQIQIMGDAVNQDFSIRVQDPGEDKDFSSNMSRKLINLLAEKYGAEKIIVKQTDYVGARFSSELGSSVFSMTLLALILILVYIWFRFRLASAVSAIIALAHDVLIMIGFIGVFQMEVVTATIAAVLTIVGYSLNDTIVVFDRIRENSRLMRDSNFKNIVNTSITQSLSRTVITSLTTLLAVVSLFIFGTGPIRDFALAMIVGVIVGTYSSIFIASPVLLGWLSLSRKKIIKSDVKEPVSSNELSIDKAADKSVSKTQITEIPVVERKLKKKKKKK